MRAIAFDFQLALSVVDATGRAFQCGYITLSNISPSSKYITCDNIVSALRCAAWLRLRKSFGTGNASDADMSGRPKVRVSLHGAQSAKALTGINRDKTKLGRWRREDLGSESWDY